MTLIFGRPEIKNLYLSHLQSSSWVTSFALRRELSFSLLIRLQGWKDGCIVDKAGFRGPSSSSCHQVIWCFGLRTSPRFPAWYNIISKFCRRGWKENVFSRLNLQLCGKIIWDSKETWSDFNCSTQLLYAACRLLACAFLEMSCAFEMKSSRHSPRSCRGPGM